MYSRARAPFAWGSNDCALFAADCVQAVTGQDLAAELRGHKDARGAARTLRRHGGLAAIAARALGAPCATVAAREGDVVLMPVGKRVALAVCVSGAHAIGPTRSGLAIVPVADALHCWKVG